jgi:predicted amidohydrolase
MKLSLAQLGAGTDKVHNLALIAELARTAVDAGSDLVAFPEFSMYDKKVVDHTFSAAAEPVDGAFVNGVRALASELAHSIVVGMVERGENDNRPFNTLVGVDATGSIVARYRKVHLFDSFGFRESDSITPSDSLEPVVFTVGNVTVGLMTCYEIRPNTSDRTHHETRITATSPGVGSPILQCASTPKSLDGRASQKSRSARH